MCGFTILNLNPSFHEGNEFKKVNESLNLIKHRGPDKQEVWNSINKEVIMAHARLSIIDIQEGNQPFKDKTGRFTIVFNGEIYNYKEIKSSLNLNPLTNSDTEILLLAYIKLKEDCLKLLKGMFAFGVWDDLEKTLFIARDRLGIKPLYFTKYNSGIVISSEIKGLNPFLKNKEIDKNSLSDYFNFQFCLRNKTLFKNVYEFPKASFTLIKNGKINSISKYWNIIYEIDKSHNEEWFVEKLRFLMKRSISLNCTADVPIASYMSGGIDSTLISLLSKDQRNCSIPNVFIGRYTTHRGFDESYYAMEACEGTNIKCNIITITPEDFINNLQKLIWHLDQPIAGPGSFGQFMVSKYVSNSFKVILGGQGGDELFGGYARYLVAYLEIALNNSISRGGQFNDENISLKNLLPGLNALESYKPLIIQFFKSGMFENLNDRYWNLINRINSYSGLINKEIINKKTTKESFNECFMSLDRSISPLNRMCNFDLNTLLPALLTIEDRVSMAHGLESRVPILDHEIVSLLATIPTEIKFKSGELKKLLKIAFKDEIPKKIIERKDKMGFPIPINRWIKENKKVNEYIMDIFKSNKARDRFYLCDEFNIEELINNETSIGRGLWSLLNLEIWQQLYID